MKHEIASKNKEIQRLNASLLEAVDDESKHDNSHLENEIRDLRDKLKRQSSEANTWKDKIEALTIQIA